MKNLTLIEILKSAAGKLFTGSDFWFYKRYGKTHSGHHNSPRDYHLKPITEEEQKTLDRMAEAVAQYQAIDRTSPEWRDLNQEFQAQRKKKNGIHSNVYAYFIHREMAKLKAEGDLAANPSKNLQDWSLKKRK